MLEDAPAVAGHELTGHLLCRPLRLLLLLIAQERRKRRVRPRLMPDRRLKYAEMAVGAVQTRGVRVLFERPLGARVRGRGHRARRESRRRHLRDVHIVLAVARGTSVGRRAVRRGQTYHRLLLLPSEMVVWYRRRHIAFRVCMKRRDGSWALAAAIFDRPHEAHHARYGKTKGCYRRCYALGACFIRQPCLGW